MSFLQRKQLADLKAECEILFQKRLTVLQEKKTNVIAMMKSDTVSFLTEQGFTVNEAKWLAMNQIEANYKGSMQIQIVFSRANECFFGADITISANYLAQQFAFSVNLSRQTFSTICEDDVPLAIEQYETMLKTLNDLACSDIDGSFEIALIPQNLEKRQFNSIVDVLKFVLEM